MAFGPSGARFRNIPGRWAAGGLFTAASLTTALTGTNNDLVFTSKTKGEGGNAQRVAYRVSGINTALRVDYDSGTSVTTVTVATDGAGAATSTAADVRAAVNARTGVPLTATDAAGNDGTGRVIAMAATALTGGTNFVIGGRR